MRADNTAHLIAAARARSHHAQKRATDALRRLDKAGSPITFGAVAAEAGVSRSWLYRQPGLRAEIERLRPDNRHNQPLLPAALRASEESLQLNARRCRPRSTGSPRRTADWPAKPNSSSGNAEQGRADRADR